MDADYGLFRILDVNLEFCFSVLFRNGKNAQ